MMEFLAMTASGAIVGVFSSWVSGRVALAVLKNDVKWLKETVSNLWGVVNGLQTSK